MTRSLALVAVMIVALAAGLTGQNDATRDAEAQMKTAALRVLRDGDARSAIEIYRKIVAAREVDPAVKAQAQLEIGRLLDKLGSEGARREYELVLENFKEQIDAVNDARARLDRAATSSGSLRLHPMWTDSRGGDGVEGSVSRDGRFACGTAIESGRPYLAVRDLATGTVRVLTNAPKADFFEGCSFSFSGDRLAYTTHGPGQVDHELLVVGLRGNAAPETLLRHPTDYFGIPDWSPDGRVIAVPVLRGRDNQMPHAASFVSFDEVLLVSLNDRSTRVLVLRGGRRVFFSPDGRYLAFDRRMGSDGSSRDVFVATLDKGEETNLTAFPSDDVLMGWSPDSRHVLFRSDRNGTSQLHTVSIERGPTPKLPTPIRANINEGETMGVTISGALYFTTRSRGTSTFLQVVPFDPVAGRYLGVPDSLGPTLDSSLLWSPDGKRIAFRKPLGAGSDAVVATWSADSGVRNLEGVPPSSTPLSWTRDGYTLALRTNARDVLQAVDVRAGTLTTVGDGLKMTAGPVWSADQTKLYYVKGGSWLAMSGNVLVERDLKSGRDREILNEGRDVAGIALSPDGSSVGVMMAADSGTRILRLVPLSGGQPRELIRRPRLGNPSFSPDGRRIAMTARDGAVSSILVVSVGDGSVGDLMRVSAPGSVTDPSWTPDSRALIVRRAGGNNDSGEIWRVPVEGGDARRVEGNISLDGLRRIALSPDGRHLAFLRANAITEQPRTEAWVLENFLPAMVRP